MTTAVPQSTIPFVDLRAQYDSIAVEIDAAISEVVQRGDFILGNAVAQFEEAFAAYSGAAFGVGVDSGTSALELALRAGGVGPGDEVITAANTFIATALAITHAGATPVLVDIDPVSQNIDPALIEAAITDRTAAIVPVHLYGRPADMDPIMEIARRRKLVVIEDASQAHGSFYKGQRVGSIGDAAAFSLYPAKNLGAFGDAGIITTNSESLAHSLRLLRNYGSTMKYYHDLKGYNRRLDTLQAAVLLVKLRHLDEWNDARRTHAERYTQMLSERSVPIGLPDLRGDDHVFHLYVVQAEHRDTLRDELADAGISTVVHYPVPIHMQRAYAELAYEKGSFPHTEHAAERVLSLPMYPELTHDGALRVVEAISHITAGR